MQRVKLNRIGPKPTYVEVPDDCTAFVDMAATLKFGKMYSTRTKRYIRPIVKYFVYWEKNEHGEWILHNEPLEELIRMGYMDNKGFQASIAKAKTEGIYALKKELENGKEKDRGKERNRD